MKAAVTFSPRDIRVESIPDPVPGSGEVLVKVDGCGICGGEYSGHKPGVKRSSKNLEATIGMGHLCHNRKPRPLHQGGGFAEYAVVSSEQCYPLPEGTSLIEAAVAEPLACYLHSTSRITRPARRLRSDTGRWLERATFRPGDSIKGCSSGGPDRQSWSAAEDGVGSWCGRSHRLVHHFFRGNSSSFPRRCRHRDQYERVDGVHSTGD